MIAKVISLEAFSAIVTAVAWTTTNSTVVLAVEFVVFCDGGWLLIRSKQASQAISDAQAEQRMASEWRENYLAERQAREDRERELAEQREAKHAALNEVASLRSRTDLTPLMGALVEIQKTNTAIQKSLVETSAALTRLVERLENGGSLH